MQQKAKLIHYQWSLNAPQLNTTEESHDNMEGP